MHNDEKLVERVAFMHGKVGTDALVEQYIEGRELYVGVLGNQRLRVLPTWEMTFSNLPEATENIATERVKWDAAYQKKLGVKTGPAASLPEGLLPRLESLCRRVYRSLSLSGCARMDLRLSPDGGMWFLEANPNPNLERGEDLALRQGRGPQLHRGGSRAAGAWGSRTARPGRWRPQRRPGRPAGRAATTRKPSRAPGGATRGEACGYMGGIPRQRHAPRARGRATTDASRACFARDCAPRTGPSGPHVSNKLR